MAKKGFYGTIYLPQYCGNESEEYAFWSYDLSWNTSTPHLPICFENTVLVGAPLLYLLAFGLFYCISLLRSRRYNRFSDVGVITLLRLFLLILLFAGSAALLIRTIINYVDGEQTYPYSFGTPAIFIFTSVYLSFLTMLEFTRGIHSSGFVFGYWLLITVCGLEPFIGRINRAKTEWPPDDVYTFIFFYILWGVIFCAFLLSFFSDLDAVVKRRPAQRRINTVQIQQPTYAQLQENDTLESITGLCPEVYASFPSKMTFAWMIGLIFRGYRKELAFKDLWDLMTPYKSKFIIQQFFVEWWRQMRKLNRNNRTVHEQSMELELSQSVRDVGDRDYQEPSMARFRVRLENKKKPSLFQVYSRVLGPKYFLAGFFMLLFQIVNLLQPSVMSLLISLVEQGSPFMWRGYLYAVLLFVLSILAALFVTMHHHLAYVTGMKLRTAVIAAVYRKALRLSAAAKKNYTAGEITNLMSVDAMKLQEAPRMLHYIWAGILVVVIALVMIWQYLQLATLAGLGSLLLLIPINGAMTSIMRNSQMTQMQEKDNRLRIINEILSGIKVLKLYAWEPSFESNVTEIRDKELKSLKYIGFAQTGAITMVSIVPFLTSLLSFGVYLAINPGKSLDPNTVFVSMTLFNLMNMSLTMIPLQLQNIIQGIVSTRRIQNFLRSEEIDPESILHEEDPEYSLKISQAAFSWGEDEPEVLRGINLNVKKGSLLAIVGAVGSGKSSIVSAMLGETVVKAGSINVDGNLAYVPQQAWIKSGTIENNITFGKELKYDKYDSTIEACALRSDLDIMPGGDQCEVGNKGLNLSGGQKQRIAIARAVYQDSDIYILDDPLSAVDAHVGKHIFDNVISNQGLLAEKTRIFVTNGVANLPNVDQIAVLVHGEIVEVGSFKELLGHNGGFASYIRQYLTDLEEDEEEILDIHDDLLERISLISGDDKAAIVEERKQRRLSRQHSVVSVISNVEEQSKEKKEEDTDKSKLVLEETIESGDVKLQIYLDYVKASGEKYGILVFIFFLLFIGCSVGSSIWLGLWSSDPPSNTTDTATLRLSVYGGIGAGMTLSSLFQNVFIALGTVCASGVLHSKLLHNLLRAPMSFFDTTPQGRIVNRISKDIDVVDVSIPITIRLLLVTLANVITTIVVISYTTPILLAAFVPLGLLYYFIQRFYIASNRQLKRIDNIMRSPVFNHFGESVNGASSIRAYKQEEKFIDYSDQIMDKNNMAFFPMITAQRWLQFHLSIVAAILVFLTCVFGITSSHGGSDPHAGLLGLSISYALRVTQFLNIMVNSFCDLESYIVSSERVTEYSDVESEAPWMIVGKRPPLTWPENGEIEMRDYSTRYRQGLDLVLRGIDCVIKPGQKVGIVGRTGAGKSSLTLALFRLIEPVNGQIIIDGYDINEMGLHDLRSKITIIPQDPVIFSGTLRSNLDPFETRDDDYLWTALEQSNLKKFVEEQDQGLEFICSEGGENLSVGQRQLVCLARAILRKTKILVLDEATAAVDLATDDLIQYTVRTQFKDCTIVTIAHRLQTIMDYDKIMVLDKGVIKEFDAPHSLLHDDQSIFHSMAKDAGLV